MEPKEIKRRKITQSLAAGEDPIVTAVDVVHELHELQEEAAAVVQSGWGDENHCSYDEGYINQAVYSCLACAPKFGFCYACSLNCHIDHVVVAEEDSNILEKDAIIELFDKRAFRCDCPCSAFCLLKPNLVASTNTENKYNHNFDGLYCWCNQPYDHDSDVIMVQCELCQDWYHQHCIENETGCPIPVDPEESESNDTEGDTSQFVCRDCIEKFSFMKHYSELKYAGKLQIPAAIGLVDATSCYIAGKNPSISGSTFFRRGWKNLICRCEGCLASYDKLGLTNILAEDFNSDDEGDQEDQADGLGSDVTGSPKRGMKRKQISDAGPIASDDMAPNSSEKQGEIKGDPNTDLFSAGMQQLGQLPFIKQVDMLQHYNSMRGALSQFFQQFVNTGQVVTQEDITRFFSGLRRQPPPS